MKTTKQNAASVLKMCEEALLNAEGAYRTLRLLRADEALPGLASCEETGKEALRAINQYLKQEEL